MDTPHRYDLDWLRVFVILMLIPFHAAVMFDLGGDFYVVNNTSSHTLSAFTDALGAWGMQLLFFVAGASSWFMLRKYSWKQFITRRLARLIVPFIVAMLTIIPLMGYFGYRHHVDSTISFWNYYPTFFTFDAADYNGYLGHLTPSHLWFVLFLFGMLLIALPLFGWLQRERGARMLQHATSFLSKPGALFLIPVMLYFFDGTPEFAERNVVSFFIFLILGFIWVSDPRLQERIDRRKYLWLTIAVVLGILWTVLQGWGEQQSGFTLGAGAFDLLHDTYTWTAILAFMALGHSFLNRPSRAIRYLGPASYPIYIIHLPIVILIGYYVVQWDVAVWVKFAVITVASFVGVGIVYEVLLRRVKVIGRMFGVA